MRGLTAPCTVVGTLKFTPTETSNKDQVADMGASPAAAAALVIDGAMRNTAAEVGGSLGGLLVLLSSIGRKHTYPA
jgi:hypothetical protein